MLRVYSTAAMLCSTITRPEVFGRSCFARPLPVPWRGVGLKPIAPRCRYHGGNGKSAYPINAPGDVTAVGAGNEKPLEYVGVYWFVWQAFYPQTRVAH
jgi:hypothetical protein